ncbi:L-aminoadipate-semialdehyde dehydrogenase-phosphopantetheinyl transferase [Sitodiplosis mosellana]|uniref:L-aminoadipate-semialdehyde dehydrogenase-phosphopantetheinyl transferase n=1 Tax=Sitodiplosis mosellana TaxID=263140 RepID=UPI002443D196|nr:L-aminoadipate-semialdehyde dehydrogenase-phosphopantetheinyl transferase [Sitodiplosis mosellana]
MSIKNGNVRWAFDLRSWRCTLNDLELATACIQPEEKDRLAKFHFLDDFKASLVGRLLMRQFIKVCLPELDYNAIRFERDSRGKPFFRPNATDQIAAHIDFNVSHHERYAVLAGSFTKNFNENNRQLVGVDVMKMEYSGGKPLSEFFRLMHSTFTPNEWQFIKARSGEQKQTDAFMRHWCLKESYVKNIGVGITIDLQSIDFRLSTVDLSATDIVRNSVVSFEGAPQNHWVFEESLLDNDHCVAVAVKNPSTEYTTELSQNELLFEMIDFERLMKDAKPLIAVDSEYSRKVLGKQLKKTL